MKYYRIDPHIINAVTNIYTGDKTKVHIEKVKKENDNNQWNPVGMQRFNLSF